MSIFKTNILLCLVSVIFNKSLNDKAQDT